MQRIKSLTRRKNSGIFVFSAVLIFIASLMTIFFLNLWVQHGNAVNYEKRIVTELEQSRFSSLSAVPIDIAKIANLRSSIDGQVIFMNLLLFGFILVLVLVFLVLGSTILTKKKELEETRDVADAILSEADKKIDDALMLETIDRETSLKNRFSMASTAGTLHIILIDINNYSMIYHEFKKSTSDDILVDFFTRIRNLASSVDASDIYRHNIDVAAIVFEKNKLSAEHFHAICAAVEKEVGFYSYLSGDLNIPIKTTIGACYQEDAMNSVLFAEKSLFSAKKNCLGVKIYTKSDSQKNRRAKYSDLSKQINIYLDAKSNNCLVPFFQPIINLSTMKIEKYEALARIKDREGIFLSPAYFLDGVREFGMGADLSKHMLDNVWEHLPSNAISINLAITDILSDELREYIFNKLSSNTQNAQNLIFEILESDNDNDNMVISDFIKNVKKYGSKIAIDDFGTGFSGYERLLTDWDIDILKIDGGIIKKAVGCKKATKIIESISEVAIEAGMETVAEHVSSKSILDLIKKSGIGFGQGYYIGQPSQHI
jgi:c-di-GMP phosphodiesterase